MTDHDNADETNGQNSKLSRRTALGLMGASAVGGAAASSAYSELTADRPIDVEVTDTDPDIETNEPNQSVLEVTNNTDDPIDIAVDQISDVGLIDSSGATVNDTGSAWELQEIAGSGGSATAEFLHKDTSNDVTNYAFDVSAFINTSGYAINSQEAVDVNSFVTDEVVEQWRINEGSDTTLNNDVADDDLSLVNDPNWEFDDDLGFDYVAFTDDSDYADGSVPFNNYDEFTFFAVVRAVETTDSRTDRIMYWGENESWSLKYMGADYETDSQDSLLAQSRMTDNVREEWSTATSTTAINDGDWHTIAATASELTGEVKIAVDGTYEDTATDFSSDGIGDVSDQFNLLRSDRNDNNYPGDIAFARVLDGVPAEETLQAWHEVLLG